MKCRNEAQITRQTCNDVDDKDCLVLGGHDCAGGYRSRCNNAVPIKFGETVELWKGTYHRPGTR